MVVIMMTTNQSMVEGIDEHCALHVAELFRAFSDTTRVRILSALANTELNVGTLAQMLEVSDSAVSHHLRGLRQMRLVTTRRSGKEIFYRMDDTHVISLFLQVVEHTRSERE